MRDITDPSALPSEPLITIVTLAELSVGPLVARDERDRAARQAHLQEAEADFDPLPFDRASARACDALIAATAMAHDLPVYPCNVADFPGIDGLRVVAVKRPHEASG